MDRQGRLAIPAKFDLVEHFSQGLAAASEGGKWGYLDRQGRWALPPAFNRAESFSQGFAWVRAGEKAGFIDKTGKMVFQPYDEAGEFSGRPGPGHGGGEMGFY